MILSATPNIKFVECINKICDEAKKQLINLKEPWDAHITVNRFIEKVSNTRIFDLINFLDNVCIGKASMPKYIYRIF